MVKVTSVSNMDYTNNRAIASLIADAKSDVTSDMNVIGLPAGFELDFGSSVLTTAGELAFMKSDGTWNWTS